LQHQAELIKKVEMSNTLTLLPPGLKFTQAMPTAGTKCEDTRNSEVAAMASWRKPVVWVGNVKEKKAAGMDILYNGGEDVQRAQVGEDVGS
jgi:hypothetical protein